MAAACSSTAGLPLVLLVSEALVDICGPEILGECSRWYASDCYCRYLERWPGAFGFLGIRNEALGCGAAHHNGRFDLDESSLPLGICAELAFLFS